MKNYLSKIVILIVFTSFSKTISELNFSSTFDIELYLNLLKIVLLFIIFNIDFDIFLRLVIFE